MKTSTYRRFGFLSAAMAVALLHSAGVAAAPSQRAIEVLGSRDMAPGAELPARAKGGSGVRGVLASSVFDAPELALTLADGRTITARLQRVARDAARGTQSWVGTFEDSPGSVLVLSRAKGVVTGFANYQDQTLEILPSKGGKHVLFAVDGSRIPQGDGVENSTETWADTATSTSDYGLGQATTTASTAVVQDLLVLYTAKAASVHGQANLESMIQSSVQAANQAYLNSKADIALNLVGLQQAAVTESSTMPNTLDAFRQNSTVRALRDKLAADMVVLVSENTDFCGYAGLWVTITATGSNTDAYAVVYPGCLSNQTLAHEVGHLQGLGHDRENEGGTPAYPYAFGYRVCVTGGFRDIMAYPCDGTNVTRSLNFSNPYVNVNGYATGIAYETNPSKSAEAARALNNSATKVAAYRVASTSTATSPVAPSGLSVQSAAYNRVTIGWVDNATNESGFKVERSHDGVTFTEVATLGADVRSFADANVTARTAYFYRVRAFNSAGTSGFSNVVSVTTPDTPPPPPPAPTGVAAVDGGNGVATVNWTVSSTAAASYEVRRQTWNAKKRVWSTAVIAATVPASMLSIADSTGAGTFRYTVRAVNAGGASAEAGPASVTVTNVTTSTKKTAPGRGKGG